MNINTLPEYKGIQDDIKAYIKDNLTDSRSAGMLANRIRRFFTEHPSDFNGLLKQYANDYPNLCSDLVSALNEEFREVVVVNPEVEKLTQESNGFRHELDTLLKNNPNLKPDDPIFHDLYEKQKKVLDRITKLPAHLMVDLRYTKTSLTSLLNEVEDALVSIQPQAQPSDIEARAKVVFQKKMGLDEALYTLLWNTRGQTLPLSVMNIKGWASRFVERLARPEAPVSNKPTMLVLRSRTDHGEQKGNTGKSRICYSCLRMLRNKGLKVTPDRVSISVPTNMRVDKAMSDNTMVFMDDIDYKDCDNEALNKFCDGMYIYNKGKYQREGFIFPFGSILGTSNYDNPYKNKSVRYPEIEFSINDALTEQNDPVVREHAKYRYDAATDTHYYDDAWETLFAYAKENSARWLQEYSVDRADIIKRCSTQNTKAEELVMVVCDELRDQMGSSLPEVGFSPREVVQRIRQNYQGELKFTPDIHSVVRILDKLKVPRAGTSKNKNPYMVRYFFPPTKFSNVVQTEITQQNKWDWIAKNADKPYAQQADI